jgi:hypothetical protein
VAAAGQRASEFARRTEEIAMSIYKLKDDDIEHEYKSDGGFNWILAAWVTVSIFGMLLPVVVFAGMMFDLW